MSAPAEEFYSEERWQNWIDRLRDETLAPDDEDSARLLLNLQDDVAIAVAKILTAYEDGDLDEEATLSELTTIREIVLTDPGIEDDDKRLLLDGVQTSLDCVFFAAEQYVVEGPAEEASVEEYVLAAGDAERQEELDRALGLVVAAGTRVIDGDDIDMGVIEELEYGYVTEWANGLDSLRNALSDPEVVEEDE